MALMIAHKKLPDREGDAIRAGWGRSLLAGLVDLVEDAPIAEMCRLRLGPAAEIAVDGSQRNVGELFAVFRQHGRITRAIVILRFDFLRRRRVKEFYKGF